VGWAFESVGGGSGWDVALLCVSTESFLVRVSVLQREEGCLNGWRVCGVALHNGHCCFSSFVLLYVALPRASCCELLGKPARMVSLHNRLFG
jgi:hypothetical protein